MTTADLVRRLRAMPRPMLIGHRGLNTVAPENSLPAIEAAAAAGADGVEIDVRCCASGELVLLHDATLERVSGGLDDREVAALSLPDLAEIELSGGARVATLRQALELCDDLDLLLNVEMKRDVPRRHQVVAATARSLRQHDGQQPVIVSTFDPFMLAAFRALAPAVPAALLLAPRHRYLHHIAAPVGALALHIDRRLFTHQLLARCHARELLVSVWTVNDLAEARRLLAAGVDGLITDDPAAMLPLVMAARETSS